MKTLASFELTRHLIECCELAITRGDPRPIPKWIPKLLVAWSASAELIAAGGYAAVMTFAAWCGLALAGTLVYAVLRWTQWITPQDLHGFFLALLVLATICVVAGRPSKTAFPGWAAKNIASAKQRFPELVHLDTKDLEAIRYFIIIAQESSKRRTTALWWMIGSIWAVSAWMITKGFDLKQGEIISFAIFPALVCFFLAGMVAAHTRITSNVYGLCATLLFDRQSDIASRAHALDRRHFSKVKRVMRPAR